MQVFFLHTFILRSNRVCLSAFEQKFARTQFFWALQGAQQREQSHKMAPMAPPNLHAKKRRSTSLKSSQVDNWCPWRCCVWASLLFRIVLFSFLSLASGLKVAELSDLRSNLSEITSALSHRVMRIFTGTRWRVRINQFSELTRVELTRFYCI